MASQLYPIPEFVKELALLPKTKFTLEGVHHFLQTHPVQPESLKPYLFFRSSHYTRNLIEKTQLYELLAICWEVGQRSQIHNHRGQSCWMAVPLGKLLVQNYKVTAGNSDGGYCELAESNRYWMDSAHPGRVEPEKPIHSVANPLQFGQRSVSIHLYSHPYDSCMVYSLEQKRCFEVPLHYSSEYGILAKEEGETEG